MKFAVVAFCTLFVVSIRAQNLGELMLMSQLFGQRPGSSSGSGAFGALTGSSPTGTSTNPLVTAALASNAGRSNNRVPTGGSSSNQLTSLMGGGGASSNALASMMGGGSGSSNALASIMGGGGASSNPMASLMGGRNMGSMAMGLTMGGAELSNLLDFYSCGTLRVPMYMCFMRMQQNM